MATIPNNQANAATMGGIMVRNRMTATKKDSSPIAPVIRGCETMAFPVRSICGCQNRVSSMENAETMTAQKSIQKTWANGLKLTWISGRVTFGTVGGIRPLGSVIFGAT